jgi:UDP-N-acetylglucosamine:LPS N-acetylglucosamine transferase
VLLVCSSGGHLLQLLALRDVWEPYQRHWVTSDRSDARSLLKDEPVTYAYWPTSRNVKNLLRNAMVAWGLVRRRRPIVILTTGAATAVPFAWIGRLHGARVVYVESLTRIERPSLSLRLISPVASRLYVQWPELVRAVPKGRYVGSVLAE